MSQPPPKSPTPSKSSLRRTSSNQNPSQRSLVPSPSPRFDDNPTAQVRYSPRSPPNQTLEYESDEDDEPLISGHEGVEEEDVPYYADDHPAHPFQPFFTLIEDGLTSEHHHPSVHYIFADDDTELITEAAIRSLEQDELGSSSMGGQAKKQDPTQPEDIEHVNDNHQHGRRLPPVTLGVREHYLIVDVHPTPTAHQATPTSHQPNTATPSPFTAPFTITKLTSFSPEWQISSASITSAPTMGDSPGEDEGLMLRIEGRGFAPVDDLDPTPAAGARNLSSTSAATTTQNDERDGTRPRESLEDMIEKFQTRLGEVKKMIEMDQRYFGVGVGDIVSDVHPAYGLGVAAVNMPPDLSSTREAYALEEQD